MTEPSTPQTEPQTEPEAGAGGDTGAGTGVETGAGAGAGTGSVPLDPTPSAPHRYDDLLGLAATFETVSADLRSWARQGQAVLTDPEVRESAELSPPTWELAEEAVHEATDSRDGLLARSRELDADALVVRATVSTYEWIDSLQEAAYRTLGTIAGRAVGFLAPEVALGGAVVSAGLIETDALDRDEVAGFLGELAAQHPELLDHLRGGGLLDDLRMRSLLTVPILAADDDVQLSVAGLRALGVEPLGVEAGAAVRDVAAALTSSPHLEPVRADAPTSAPRCLADLITVLAEATSRVVVHEVAPSRYVAHLPGTHHEGGVRLVTGDPTTYAEEAVAALEEAIGDDESARVMLVGAALGGSAAALVAAGRHRFAVDHLVTAGAPAAHVTRVPGATRVLSLEDRHDPVALLGALVTRTDRHRVHVVFDGRGVDTGGLQAYLDGARAADASTDPVLREAIGSLVEQGYLRE